MQINLSSHHVYVTQALKSHVETNLEHLEHHDVRITNVAAIRSAVKPLQEVESAVRINGGRVYVDSDSPDLYARIEQLVDKLDRELNQKKREEKGTQTPPLNTSNLITWRAVLRSGSWMPTWRSPDSVGPMLAN